MRVLIATSGLLPPSDSFAASSLSPRAVILSLRRSGVRCHESLTFRGGVLVARLTCGKESKLPLGELHRSPAPSLAASLPCSRGMKVPLQQPLGTDEVPGSSAPLGDASVGGCPTSSSRAGSLLCRRVSCRLPRDTVAVAWGQPGCACSTASLPRSPLVSPSLSSLQSNLLNSPCPRARSVHFHDVSPVCPRAAHRGSPLRGAPEGQQLIRQRSGGEAPHLRFSVMPELACRTED